ncbi:MAG TPA: DUF2085 domain-containing protein [Candidatus Bilamarchaeum sp.]|nr:DUF2085 domain-containing protein [Candidatus Bilamarchaeum sp.]
MENARIVYALYMGFFALLMGSILITPYLAFSSDMGGVYGAFAATCHQKLSRSLCLFNGAGGYWIGDCVPQTGAYVENDRTQIRVQNDSVTGYKLPVCSRDIGLYGAMLLGGLIYPFVKKIGDRKVYPAIWLVVAIVPLGLDGSIQLVSELGLLPFVYESTNLIRLLTGAIAGIAAAFYAIPILVNIFSRDEPAAKAIAGAAPQPKARRKS